MHIYFALQLCVQELDLKIRSIIFKQHVPTFQIGRFLVLACIMLFSSHGLLACSLTTFLFSGATVADDARSRAQDALNTLQDWYNAGTGLWDTCGWWNGANVMTTIADLALVDSSVMDTASYVFNNTLIMAPPQNPHPGPEVKTNYARDLTTRVNSAVNASEWLDSAYDDDGWWALAWIAAYDVTEENQYLQLAEGIFDALVCISYF
jgi:hypothetical protein